MRAYAAQAILAAPARPTNSPWRLIAGVILIVALFIGLDVILFGNARKFDWWPALAAEMGHGSTPRAIWVALGNFAVLLVALAISLRLVHRRGLAGLLGPVAIAWHDFRRVFAATATLFAVVWMIPGPAETTPVPNMPFGDWVSLLPLSVVLIFLQIATEELLFRGYLQSQLSARFASPIVWIVAPSLLFGALHFDPGVYGGNAILIALWSTVFGLAAADLTARAGNLGPALALHFVNNLSAILLTALEDEWDGLALMVIRIAPDDATGLQGLLILEGGIILCSWLAARLAIRR